jgi:hypothetical protein
VSGHGGKRAGAGRPAGSGWLPAITEMRVQAAELLSTIVGSERDPLAIMIDFAADPELDVPTRMGAASIAIPYLYPRLSATQVSANHTVTRLNGADVLARLEERLARTAGITVEAAVIEHAEDAPDEPAEDAA